LIALSEARGSGRGQQADVSAQRAKNLAAFFNQQNTRIGNKRVRRSGSGFTFAGVTFPFVWQAADGFVSLTIALDAGNKPFLDRLIAYMVEEDAIDADLASRDWTAELRAVRRDDADNTNLQRLVDAITAFLAARKKADLMAAALDRRLLLVPVSTLEDLLDSPQLVERGFWRDCELGDGRTVRLPAHLVKASNAAAVTRPTVPKVGEHTEEVLGRPRRPVASQSGPAATPASGLPLAGLRVLDFMWVMAGPTSTGVLAQYGATVVRLENAARIDTVRLLAPYYDGKAGRETSLPFACINAGKLSVTLDPNVAEAREVIADLVQWADAVTESFSPKAMKGWGLDYESLRRIKPDLVMLSSCLFGQDGPLALVAGYGTMGAAVGGMVQPTGWPDQPPAGPYGAYTDACSPRMSVAALLAALEHHRLTGEGVYIDQSQIEASMHYMLPAIVDHQLHGSRWDRMANTDPELCPHGVFPCAGDEEWAAVAVRDGRDWQALCRVIGRADLADDATLADVARRRERVGELDDAIAQWTSRRGPQDVERELQQAGVPAHAVTHSDSPPDPQLDHARHTVTVTHSGRPDRLIERTRIELSRTPPDPHHVPAMGEHTELVLRDLLGYDDERIARLGAAGALGGQPNR
jgi:crotonobetainyl-CoA:carnitine CoA-transferase CaiB-like acyl-CoA transferase